MSLSKLAELPEPQLIGLAAGVSALGALIAYLASARSNQEIDCSQPALQKSTTFRDRSEGKKVGKSIKFRKGGATIIEESDEDDELARHSQSVQELVENQLIQQRKKQAK